MLKPKRLSRIAFLVGASIVSLAAFAQTQSPAAAPAIQAPAGTKQPVAFSAETAAANSVDDLKVVSLPGEHLRVQIAKPTDLSRVFKAVCSEQKLVCTGADTLGSYSVPDMVAEGTLREVVENLLGGTGVNYRYTRATATANAKLLLLGHAPKGTNTPPPATPVAEEAPRPVPLRPVRFPGNLRGSAPADGQSADGQSADAPATDQSAPKN